MMEVMVKAAPGYRANDYLLVLKPHEELMNKILQVKSEFYKKFNISAGISPPQIVLVTFTQYEMVEERIIRHLQTIAMGYPPFKIEVKDFGSFPTHTIYIQVTSKLPIQHLIKKIRTDSQRLMKMDEENKPHFILEPHITIAGKLKPWQYEKGWLEYSHKHFQGRFIAGGMALLKRLTGEIKYHKKHWFEFQNLPVETKQGKLFG